MRREHLSKRIVFAGIVVAGGLGCSNGDTQGNETGGSGGSLMGGTGGVGSPQTGGSMGGGGKSALGGTGGGGTSSTTGGSAGSGGAPAGTGGTLAGAGGAQMAGAGTGASGKGGVGAGGAGGGDAGMAGKGMAGGGGMGTGGKAGSGPGGGAGKAGSSGTGGGSSGTCTASKSTGKSVTGTGPHKVVIETNSANGIKCGTIYRPEDLGGTEKYPIFVWGEGGCSQDGYSNQAAMGEIASWGYFIVADGTPGSSNACQGGQDGKAFLDYITWAIAENDKSCSAYYQSLEPTKIAADGFSCGGLMSENVSGDPRFSAIGITSSGLMSANAKLYDAIHTPFKIMNGGSSDIAYDNGRRDYDEISSRGIPILYFSKTNQGHGGDLGQARGDFNKVNLAWLNWQLKGDESATGKGYLYGSTCTICTNSGWDYKSANIP